MHLGGRDCAGGILTVFPETPVELRLLLRRNRRNAVHQLLTEIETLGWRQLHQLLFQLDPREQFSCYQIRVR